MPEKNSKTSIFLSQLCGCDDGWIDRTAVDVPIHKLLVKPFLQLKLEGEKEGFDICIASGYRDFSRQLMIWNNKAEGKRPVFDDDNKIIDMSTLVPWEKAQAILRWSALPGASRHHWGTDIDIFDRSAVEENYALQLSADEFAQNGPFGPMNDWLDSKIKSDHGHGFFKPYVAANNGVAPEPWHLSYAPLAAEFQKAMTVEGLKEFLSDKSMALRSVVLDNFQEIYERFVIVNHDCYPSQYREFLRE